MVNLLMKRHEYGREERNENIELLKEHMEKKMGSQVLQTSLDDWDDQKEYDEELERRMEGIKIALMVLKQTRGKELEDAATPTGMPGKPR